MSYILQFLATAWALYIASPYISNWANHPTSQSALIVFVIVLAVLNTILGTALRFITFPVKLLTLGISSFLISMLMVYLASQIVPGIDVRGIIPITIVALITSVISMLFRAFR